MPCASGAAAARNAANRRDHIEKRKHADSGDEGDKEGTPGRPVAVSQLSDSRANPRTGFWKHQQQ
eukprot:7140757-Prymnesium_polylepis.1